MTKTINICDKCHALMGITEIEEFNTLRIVHMSCTCGVSRDHMDYVIRPEREAYYDA